MCPQVMHTRVGALTAHSTQLVFVISSAELFVSFTCGHSLSLILVITFQSLDPRRILIAVNVFFISIAIVSGPTPPGTGVR